VAVKSRLGVWEVSIKMPPAGKGLRPLHTPTASRRSGSGGVFQAALDASWRRRRAVSASE